jgi:LCP family protein required for cell wall assembly
LDTKTPATTSGGRSPSVAAILSFIWPGLGQLYTGNRRLAAIFGIPALILLPLLAYQLRQGAVVFGARFTDPTYVLWALVIVVIFGLWRLASVTQLFFGGTRGKRPILDRLVLAALAAIIILTHGAGSYLLALSYSSEQNIYQGGANLVDNSAPPSYPLIAGDTSTPFPSPTATPTEAPDGRVTILFTGVDAAPGRGETAYDSQMVVSFNPKDNTIQMISIPREFAGFPFYFGGVDPLEAHYEITYMPTDIRLGQIRSPDAPYTSLVNQVQFLLGVHIDYWAVMNLQGFVKMIDTVGGIDVNSKYVIADGMYDDTFIDGTYGIYIGAGPQHLNGKYALAYARDRLCGGCNDYKRAARQQEVILALLHKMSQPGEILQLPTLISQVGSSVQTSPNFKPSMVADYVAAAQNVPAANFTNLVLSPPDYAVTSNNASICPIMPKLSALSIKLFGQDSLWLNKPTPRNICP